MQKKKQARKGSVCKGCGIYIEWLKTKAGRDMPIDPAEIAIITEKGEIVKGFIPHWTTCPKAEQFHKK